MKIDEKTTLAMALVGLLPVLMLLWMSAKRSAEGLRTEREERQRAVAQVLSRHMTSTWIDATRSIKSLAENYHNVTGLSGASILGHGRVSLILDVGALIDLACKKQHQSEPGSHRPYREPAETKLTSDITEPLGDCVSAEGAKS